MWFAKKKQPQNFQGNNQRIPSFPTSPQPQEDHDLQFPAYTPTFHPPQQRQEQIQQLPPIAFPPKPQQLPPEYRPSIQSYQPEPAPPAQPLPAITIPPRQPAIMPRPRPPQAQEQKDQEVQQPEPRQREQEQPPQEGKPIFIQLQQYREARAHLEVLRQKIKETEYLLDKIEDLRAQEHVELQNCHETLNKLKEKFIAIDKKLFEV